MTSKNKRAPLPYYFKLWAFRSHRWIQTGVTVRKRSSRVRIGEFFSHVTLKFDRQPWKTIGHFFYAASNFMHHFVAISESRLELQSGNALFGSKLAIFCAMCIDIWQMTLKNNGAPLRCHFKLCTSFRSHLWIQARVTVQKCPNWGKISCVPCGLIHRTRHSGEYWGYKVDLQETPYHLLKKPAKMLTIISKTSGDSENSWARKPRAPLYMHSLQVRLTTETVWWMDYQIISSRNSSVCKTQLPDKFLIWGNMIA